MQLRRSKIQKFSYPGEGDTPSPRAPSPADFILITIQSPYLFINKNSIMYLVIILLMTKILLKSENAFKNIQNLKIFLPEEWYIPSFRTHPLQTLSLLQSPYYLLIKKMTCSYYLINGPKYFLKEF